MKARQGTADLRSIPATHTEKRVHRRRRGGQARSKPVTVMVGQIGWAILISGVLTAVSAPLTTQHYGSKK